MDRRKHGSFRKSHTEDFVFLNLYPASRWIWTAPPRRHRKVHMSTRFENVSNPSDEADSSPGLAVKHDQGQHDERQELRSAEDLLLSGCTVDFNNEINPYTNQLFNELVNKGHDLVALSCNEQEWHRQWAASIKPNYVHKALPGFSIHLSGRRVAHVNLGIFRALSEIKPSRVIIHGIFPSMLFAAIWAIFNKVPFGFYTDGWALTMPNSLYHLWVRPFILKHCFAAACSGTKGAAFLRDQGIDEGRIFVVPLVPAWAARPGIADFAKRPFDLLWCARMNETEKNVSFFVDVALVLQARSPNLKIRLVGQGPCQEAVLQRLTAAGVSFQHDAHLPWDTMEQVYSQAKLLIFPSVWEPWGLVTNEAMQCGTPAVVSPQVGAAEDLVISGVNGIVLPLDVKRWADTIQRILEDETEWKRLSLAAVRDSHARTIQKSVNEFERFLSKVGFKSGVSKRVRRTRSCRALNH